MVRAYGWFKVRAVVVVAAALALVAATLPGAIANGHTATVVIDDPDGKPGTGDEVTAEIEGQNTEKGRSDAQDVKNALEKILKNCEGFKDKAKTAAGRDNAFHVTVAQTSDIEFGHETSDASAAGEGDVSVDPGDVKRAKDALDGGSQAQRDKVAGNLLAEVLAHEIIALGEDGHDHDSLIPQENECLKDLGKDYARVDDCKDGKIEFKFTDGTSVKLDFNKVDGAGKFAGNQCWISRSYEVGLVGDRMTSSTEDPRRLTSDWSIDVGGVVYKHVNALSRGIMMPNVALLARFPASAGPGAQAGIVCVDVDGNGQCGDVQRGEPRVPFCRASPPVYLPPQWSSLSIIVSGPSSLQQCPGSVPQATGAVQVLWAREVGR